MHIKDKQNINILVFIDIRILYNNVYLYIYIY